MCIRDRAGAVVTWRRGDAAAIPVTLAFYALMEGLQLAGYMVIDQCGSTANQTITVLSMLHIAVQPLILNDFIMALVRADLTVGQRRMVYGLSALASALILVQLLPVAELGTCPPVSYTHLDVYKRQGELVGRIRFGWRGVKAQAEKVARAIDKVADRLML